MEKQYEVQVLIHTAEDGSLWANIAELPGVFASGADHEELLACLNEALEMYLEETGIPPELDEQRVEIQRFSLRGNGLVPA